MARFTEDLSGGGGIEAADSAIKLTAGNDTIHLPEGNSIADAELIRDGNDLILRAEDGTEVVVEGYFLASPQPMIFAADGTGLSPDMVQSFLQHDGPLQYAQNSTMSDTSPIGFIKEASGDASVTRTDGSSETITVGTPIFQGDIVETDAEGAVNILFIDESSFAVSNNARLAIDEYIYDPATDSGTSNFSMLRGMFIYTSGLIGREDPDDVEIDTPMGSIGIRGTVIAGDVDNGEITVVEGAIVLRSFNGEELTLATQFETGKFMPQTGELVLIGTSNSGEIGAKFSSINAVTPDFFSGLNSGNNNGDNAADSQTSGEGTTGETQSGGPATSEESSASTTEGASATPEPVPDTTTTTSTASATTDTSLSTTDSSATSFDGSASSFDSTSGETTTTSTSSTSTGTTTTTTTTSSTSTTSSGTTNGDTTTTTAPPPTNTGGTGGTGTPVNGAPTISGATTTLAENTAVNTTVHTVIATDPESDPLTYSITGGNAGGEFAINASTGEITLANPLDYETVTSYNLTVSAFDGTNTSSNTVVVNVSDVNEYSVGGITDTDAAANSISEDAASGATVGITAYAQDLDGTNNTITYSLTAGNDGGGRFEIDATSGVVTYNGGGALDFETSTAHNIQVKATSSDGSSSTMSYTISVEDVDDTAPTGIDVSFSVNEDVGAVIDLFSLVNDVDTTLTKADISVSGATNGTVSYNSTTGQATYTPTADFNGNDSFTYTVTDGVRTATHTVSVTINPANDAPVLSGAPIDMTDVNEDVTTPPGDTVNAILNGTFYDVDGDPAGMAITAVDTTNGSWEYSVDGGTSWTVITGVSETNALLLDGAHLVRFVPTANYDGTATFDYKAWDQSSGTAESTADTTSGTAFSSTSETATVNVLPDTDYENSGTYTLTTGNDTATVSGTSVTLNSDAGMDTINVSGNSNWVYGDLGADTITVSGNGNQIFGDQDNDVITVTGTGVINNTINGGVGDDSLILDINAGSGNSLYGGDGNDTITVRTNDYWADGGLGTGDTLVFDAGGSFDINDTTVNKIEIIDSNNAGNQTLNFKITNSLLANDTNDLVINIDGVDTANFDFTTWDGAGAFVLQSGSLADDTLPTVFHNSTTGQTITVNRATGSVVNETGLATHALDSNLQSSGNGFWLHQTAAEGFGYNIAAMYDSDSAGQDGKDDLLIGTVNNQFYSYTGTLSAGSNAGFTDTNTNPGEMSMSYVGDFNGDGVSDFIVGMSGDDTAGIDAGGAKIFDVNGNPVYNFPGPAAGDMAGASVAGIGDINGDGYDDVLIGAPGSDANGTESGSAWIVYGNNALANTAIDGVFTGGKFGKEIAGIGDINSDGLDDFMVSEISDSTNKLGQVNIFYGSETAITYPANITLTNISLSASDMSVRLMDMGDFNGDGTNDIGLYASGSNSIHFYYGGHFASGAAATQSNFTISTTADYKFESGGGIGDFNGDGIDDAAFVLKGWDGANHTDVAHIYVVYGQTGTTGTLAQLDGTDVAGTFHMTYNIPAGADFNNFDFNIAAAGDLNGDGFYDFTIGMPDKDNDADLAYDDGSVAVIYGRGSGPANIVTDSSDGTVNNIVSASADGQDLIGGGVNGMKLEDGGNANISMSGGAYNQTFAVSRTDFFNIDGGAGHDILEASGSLDFSAVNGESLTRIEEIFITNGSSVTLTLDNIFQLAQGSDSGTDYFKLTGTGNLVIDDQDGNNAEGLIDLTLAAIANEFDVADGGSAGSVTHDGANTITFANGVELFISTDLLTTGVDVI